MVKQILYTIPNRVIALQLLSICLSHFLNIGKIIPAYQLASIVTLFHLFKCYMFSPDFNSSVAVWSGPGNFLFYCACKASFPTVQTLLCDTVINIHCFPHRPHWNTSKCSTHLSTNAVSSTNIFLRLPLHTVFHGWYPLIIPFIAF